jgi:hypothetical protein
MIGRLPQGIEQERFRPLALFIRRDGVGVLQIDGIDFRQFHEFENPHFG